MQGGFKGWNYTYILQSLYRDEKEDEYFANLDAELYQDLHDAAERARQLMIQMDVKLEDICVREEDGNYYIFEKANEATLNRDEDMFIIMPRVINVVCKDHSSIYESNIISVDFTPKEEFNGKT